MIKKRKKQRRKVKTLFVFKRLSFVSIILACIYLLYNLFFALTFNVVTQSQFLALDQPISILVMGTDSGGSSRSAQEGWVPRADSIMLLTLNPTNNRENIDISMTSIPRDTRVYIPCTDSFGKVNASMSYGYQKTGDMDQASLCTKQAVEQGLGISIDYYITADFNGLIDLIDGIGGIQIDVPYAFTEQDSNGTADAISIPAGKQTLSGEEALAYSRQRHAINPETGMSGDDWERNIRQQEVLAATLKKILSDPTQYSSVLLSVVYNDMWTDIPAESLTKLVNFGVSFYNQQIMALANHQPLTVYFKESSFQHAVGINPYQDLSGFDFTNVEMTSGSDYVTTPNYFSENTYVYPATIGYRGTEIPTIYDPSLTTPVQDIEFSMSTLSTLTAEDGSGDEIVNDQVRYYFATQIAESSGQETTLEIDPTTGIITSNDFSPSDLADDEIIDTYVA